MWSMCDSELDTNLLIIIAIVQTLYICSVFALYKMSQQHSNKHSCAFTNSYQEFIATAILFVIGIVLEYLTPTVCV